LGKFIQGGNSAGDNPYVSTVTSGVMTSNPPADASYVAPGVGACPGGAPHGCNQITVDGEPCNKTPFGSDPLNCPKNGAWSFLQNSAVGDGFQIVGSGGTAEFIALVGKSGNVYT